MKTKSFLFCGVFALLVGIASTQSSVAGGKHHAAAMANKLKTGAIEKMTTDSANCKITMGDRFKIAVSVDGKECQFPSVYKFGNNIFVSYSEHPDAVLASPTDALIISRDNGKTWDEKIQRSDFYFTSMVEKNGILYGIVYFTYPDSPTTEKMVYWTSADLGKTWVKHGGIVNAPHGQHFKKTNSVWGSMLFHRGMQVMADGSIEGPMYGYFDNQPTNYTVAWVKSTDNCATWQIGSTIATGTPAGDWKKPDGYCEPTFAKTRDGSLLCVMRIGSYLPLFQSRSRDNGATWSAPVQLPGLTATESESVDAQMLLMSNGVLALSYGRPDDMIAFSTDGNGEKWDCHATAHVGETTGYTGIVETDPGRLLLVADQGRTGAKDKAVWGRFIDVGIALTTAAEHEVGK